MRKLFFAFVAVLWIVAGVQLIQSLNQEDEEQIVQAFNGTNCMSAASSVRADAQLSGYRTRSEQIALLESVAGELGISGSMQLSEDRTDNRTTLELSRKAAKAQTSLRLVSIENELGMGTQVETVQYLLVSISLYDNLECGVLYKSSLEEIIQKYDENANVTLQFDGELAGELSAGEQKELCTQLLKQISAKVRGEYEAPNAYTVYAYTELAGDYEYVSGEAVNVTVAVTYDEQSGHTRLYVATPLLNEDY